MLHTMSRLSIPIILAALCLVFAQSREEGSAKDQETSSSQNDNGNHLPTTDSYTGAQPGSGRFANDPQGAAGSSASGRVVLIVGAIVGAIIVVLLIFVVSWFWRRKSKREHRYRRMERSGRSEVSSLPVSHVQINWKDVGNDGYNEASCLELQKPSRQQVITKLESYRELSVVIDGYHRDRPHSWAFGSCIYSLEPHDSEGPFEVEVVLSVDLVRDKEGKLLTEFCVWHSGAVEGVAPLWKCLPEVKVKIGEDDKTAHLVLPHLCRICLEARGDFRQTLIVLPFLVPAPPSHLVTLKLYFDKMLCARERQSERDIVMERDKLINSLGRLAGRNAVFCGSEKFLTVKSLVRVKCSLPEHLVSCVPWKGGDCKVLTETQLEGLCQGKLHACLCRPSVEFVVQLAEPARMGHPLCFELTYSDCEDRLIDSHTIIYTQYQSTTPEEAAAYVPRGIAVATPCAQGTFLHDVPASIRLPNILDAYGVWEKLACYHEWCYTALDVESFKRDAATHRRKEAEVFLGSLTQRFADVTIEKLVAVMYVLDLGGIAEVIKRRACDVGQFDAALCDSLLEKIHRKSRGLDVGDCRKQISPARLSPRQLLRSPCRETTRSQSTVPGPKWVRADSQICHDRMAYLVDAPCAVAGTGTNQSSVGPVPSTPSDSIPAVAGDNIEMQTLPSHNQVALASNHQLHCHSHSLGNEAASANVLRCSSSGSVAREHRESYYDVRQDEHESHVTVLCQSASHPPPTLNSVRREQEHNFNTPTHPPVIRRPPSLPVQNSDNSSVVAGGRVNFIEQVTMVYPNIPTSQSTESDEDLTSFNW